MPIDAIVGWRNLSDAVRLELDQIAAEI